jgi:uncharacterized protein (DUF433 family)
MDIYGGKDPRIAPRYTVAEAALYVGVPAETLRTWVRGRTPTGQRRGAEPLVRRPKGSDLLSFQNLVEAHVLGSIRRHHRIPLQRVRKALHFVERKLGQPHPLITAKFETDGVDLFVRELGRILNACQGGQVAIREALQASLQRVEYDRDGVAGRLFPFVRTGDADEPKSVVIDPRVSFGRPVLLETGIPTSMVKSRLKAGETLESIASDYGITLEQLGDAIRYELPAAA